MTPPANDLQQVTVTSRAAWRAWLCKHHTQRESIWLVTYKKHTGRRHVPSSVIAEEALCFGWIDSLPRKLDDDRTMLRISPRQPGSIWSKINKQRVARLIKAGLMTPAGQAVIDRAKQDGSWTIYDDCEQLVIPADLAAALAAAPPAADNFTAFSPSVKKALLWWIKSAKRAPTRQKRIEEVASKAALNKRAQFDR